MREALSKSGRLEISNSVKELVSQTLLEMGFSSCKISGLWSKEYEKYFAYIRLKRTSNFSEWPHFKINFGFTPKFDPDIELILDAILRTNQPMYEIWSNGMMSQSEHYRLNTKALYSSAEPGTWEFRSRKEVAKKVAQIDRYIRDYFPLFLVIKTSDEAIVSCGFEIIDELPSNFRVLQIVSFGNLNALNRIEDCISYYRNGNFGKGGSRFTKPLEKYGDELLNYFKHR